MVIDESSMLGHKDAVKLFKLAEKLALKLVFVGDPLQHGSVPRGSFMRVLKDYAGLSSFRLTEIMRQEDRDYRAAAQSLSEGKTLEGFDAIDRKGWVRECRDDASRYAAIGAEYLSAVQEGVSCLVVSPTHREAASIVAEIRSRLKDAGLLGKEEHAFTRLTPVADVSEAQKGLATTYQKGDVLIFHQNCKGGFVKGQRIDVTDPSKVPVAAASAFSLYRPETIMLADGDKIRFTGTVKARDGTKLSNGDTHKVTAIKPGKSFRLDNGLVIDADAGLFRSAFCETSFGAQGRTVQRVILGMASASFGATNQEQIYVSSTRAKQKLSLFTDDKHALRSAILKSSQKLAALDIKSPPPAAARLHWWNRLKGYLDRRRREAALNQVRAGFEIPQRQPERQAGYGR